LVSIQGVVEAQWGTGFAGEDGGYKLSFQDLRKDPQNDSKEGLSAIRTGLHAVLAIILRSHNIPHIGEKGPGKAFAANFKIRSGRKGKISARRKVEIGEGGGSLQPESSTLEG